MKNYFHKELIILLILIAFTSCSKDNPSDSNSAPNAFTVQVNLISESQALLSWGVANDPDGDSVNYSVILNGQEIANSLQVLTFELNNLTPSTSYSGKVVATDSNNNNTESNFNFISTSVPKLQTFEISDLNAFSVDVGGLLLDEGSSEVTEVGLVVGFSTLPTIDINLNKFELSLNEENEFHMVITNIPANNTFYLRAYGINNDGVGYGNEVQFTSLQEMVYNDDITLTTQEEVIEFGANNYTKINGSMYINGSVSDLSPLESIVIVNNAFEIKNTTNLINLDGLNNLRITGNVFPNGFRIMNNSGLESLFGLNNLEKTRGDAYIVNNDNLTNLEGLNSYVAASAGELRIQECDNLLSLSGLENLEGISDSLIIMLNPQLNDISSLSNLIFIERRIHILYNNSLPNLNGLGGITSLEGITLESNNNLTNTSGIGNLTSVTDVIEIMNNDSLNDLSGFQNIDYVYHLKLENNNSLTDLQGLSGFTTIGGLLDVNNNSNLISLSGINNLSSLNRIEIQSNNSLINLEGLNGLTNINDMIIYGNESLTSLTGLENLSELEGHININSNPILADFCSLYNLFSNGSIGIWQYASENNLENPSIDYIINNCN